MNKSKIMRVCLIGILVVTGLVMGACLSFGQKSAPEEAIDVANFTNRSMMQMVSRITDDGLSKASPKVSPDGSKLLYCETKTVYNTETRASTTTSDIVMLRNINSCYAVFIKSITIYRKGIYS